MRGAPATGAGGIGLGLYIARQLARAQGGDLVLAEAGGLDGAPERRPAAADGDEREHRGARFELRLPLADEDAARVRYVAGAGRNNRMNLAGPAPEG